MAWVAARGSYRSAALAAMLAAAVYAFVHALTNPPPALMLVTALVMAVWFRAGAPLSRVLAGGGVTMSAWVLDYVTTMLARWVVATPVMGVDVVWRNVTNQISARADGDFDGVSHSFGAATARNSAAWRDQSAWGAAGHAP